MDYKDCTIVFNEAMTLDELLAKNHDIRALINSFVTTYGKPAKEKSFSWDRIEHGDKGKIHFHMLLSKPIDTTPDGSFWIGPYECHLAVCMEAPK